MLLSACGFADRPSLIRDVSCACGLTDQTTLDPLNRKRKTCNELSDIARSDIARSDIARSDIARSDAAQQLATVIAHRADHRVASARFVLLHPPHHCAPDDRAIRDPAQLLHVSCRRNA